MHIIKGSTGILATLLLAGCGGSSGGGPAEAAYGSGGPGAVDAENCAIPYGDPPRPPSSSTSPGGVFGEIANLLNQCLLIGGETLNWTDAQNEARAACLIAPAGATPQSKLPLVVFLHGSLVPAPMALIRNNWVPLTSSADLNGDPQHPGFTLLVPIGRNIKHVYPFPNDEGLGWDNWYRNFDRSSPDLNLDAAAIDQFISQVESRGIVDTNRVYATGWSNGAAMAQLYALNTPSIAAVAVYSSPDPFSDANDPCWQTPFATTQTPLMDIHNACDIAGICQTGTKFHQDLATLYPNLPQNHVIVDTLKNQVQACDASCASEGLSSPNPGGVNHLIWPLTWNDAMFSWLRDHPLNSKQ